MPTTNKSHGIRRFLILCLIALLGSAVLNLLLADGFQIFKNTVRHRSSEISLADAKYINLEEQDGTLLPQNDDAQILLSNPDGYIQNLKVSITVEGNLTTSLKIYYASANEIFNEEDTCEELLVPGQNEIVFPIHHPVTQLRIDPGQTTLVHFSEIKAEDISDFQIRGYASVFAAKTALFFLLILFLGAHVAFPLDLLYSFLYKNRFAIGISLILFGVIFNINGSSLSRWFTLIPSENTGLMFGEGRTIRSDEYAVFTSMIFSQARGTHPYSWFSDLLRGTSTDTCMIYALPVKSWIMIFRPFLLGFLFLGNERGLAFFWWARAVCLWLTMFQLLLLLTGKRKRLSAAGACMILFSPLLQWWFTINALPEMLIAGSLFVLLLDHYLKDSRICHRILCLLGMVLCGGGYILTLYPAWMVPLAYLYLVLTIWVVAKNHKTSLLKLRDFLGFAAAIALLVLCMLMIFRNSRETIQAIMNTAYPGHHTNNGGGLNGNFTFYPATLFFSQQTEGVFPNVCESAAFFDFFPLGIVLSAYILIRKRGRDLLTWLLLTAGLFLSLWCVVGFPEPLARLTMMNVANAARTYPVVSLIHLLLLLRAAALLPTLPAFPAGSIRKPLYLAGAVLFSILYTSEVVQSTRQYFGAYITEQPVRNTIMVLVLLIGALLLFFYVRLESVACFFLAIVLFVANIGVNPVQVGTGDLFTTDLAVSIQEIAEKDPQALWVVSNGLCLPQINYPIMMGAPTLNSTNTYPDLERWASIDPEGQYEEIYNRYAHIFVDLMKSEAPNKKFRLDSNDSFTVFLSPEDVQTLGIKYILSDRNLSYLSGDTITYTKICQANGLFIFRADPSAN